MQYSATCVSIMDSCVSATAIAYPFVCFTLLWIYTELELSALFTVTISMCVKYFILHNVILSIVFILFAVFTGQPQVIVTP